MSEQNMERTPDDETGDELAQSPAPDPEASDPTAEDVPTADWSLRRSFAAQKKAAGRKGGKAAARKS